jgi:hypothetical protein
MIPESAAGRAGSSRHWRVPRLAGPGLSRFGILAGLALLAALAAWMIVSQAGGGSKLHGPSGAAAFEEQTGIRVFRVALTGGGGIVDIRYRVLDPDKAPILHEPGSRLTLRDDSGEILSTPAHLHSASGSFQAGVAYYELLVNTAGLLERGDRISVVVGRSSLDNIPVR